MLSISTKENIDGIYSKVASLGMGSYGDVYLYERT